MSSSVVLGQFLWHELLTSDPEAGAGFYAKVLGWKAQPSDGDAAYTMLANAHGPVGGARVVGKDPLAGTVGPNWLTYVGVPEINAALATVETHGGRVIHPVTSVPADGGRYAVIADPQGGIIGLYEPSASMPAGSAERMAGPVVWHELTADDVEEALRFYQAIFGWEVVGSVPMGGDVGTYYLFGIGTTQMGGAFKRSTNLPPTWPRWLVYLAVPSVTAAVKATEGAGGQLLNGPNQVPGGNWIAQVVDSRGVPVALHGPKEAASRAKPKAKAGAKPKAAAQPKATAEPAAAVKPSAAKPKPKPKPKAKVKVKAKVKTKVKAKAKTKKKAPPKSKVAVRRRSKVRAKPKSRAKTKSAVKARGKSKPRSNSRAARRPKARKGPRRPK